MWEALVPVGASLLSGLFGRSGQESANRTNIQLGREQMAFQREMSSSAYQRAVLDMKRAGLNPMLAYSQGGASAPMGSMPQVQNVNSAGITSAAQGMAMAQGVQQLLQSQAQTDNLNAAAEKLRSETMDQKLNSARLMADIGELRTRSDKQWQEALTEAQRPANVRADTEVKKYMGMLKQLEVTLAGDTFSADVARRKAESELTRLEIPKAKGEAKFYEKVEELPAALRMLMMILRGGSSVRQMTR